MKRYYYISAHLSELEALEKELHAQGINRAQCHVLSNDDASVNKHHLNSIEAAMKKDVVRWTKLGAVIGGLAALLVLWIADYYQLTQTEAGWVPFIFLAIVLVGFCTWEGGFKGIQEPHFHFKYFQHLLNENKHVFFVDIDKAQELYLKSIVQHYPNLQAAGSGKASPSWWVSVQKCLKTMP